MLIIKISKYKDHFSLVQGKVLCNKSAYIGDIKISKELIRILEVLKIDSILVCC